MKRKLYHFIFVYHFVVATILQRSKGIQEK